MAIRNIEKHIRLSEKEDDILRRKAEKLNIGVCEYIRRMAVNGKILRYDILSLHDNLISFRMVGTELNAIAKNLIPQNLNSNLFPKARKYGIIEA